MKKISVLLSIVLLAVMSIACTETKIEAEELSGDLILEAIVETGGNSEITSKSSNIYRGTSVPVYVEGLTYVIAEGSVNTGDKVGNVLYTQDASDTAASNMVISNVSFNATKITATTTSTEDADLPIMFFALDDQSLVSDNTSEGNLTARAALLLHIAKLYNDTATTQILPYAKYSGESSVDMTSTNGHAVSVDLTSTNGRDFGTIVNNSKYRVEVTMETLNQDYDSVNNTTQPAVDGSNNSINNNIITFDLSAESTEALGYYWSNKTAVTGNYGIAFKVEWFNTSGNLIKTAAGTRIISNAYESYWSNITITDNNIQDKMLHSTFNFTPIDEIGGNYEF